MAVTIQQIAERAGVSRGTVDRALNNRGRINPEVAQRIRKIANEMGYITKSERKASSLKNNIKIGIITQLANASFMQEIHRGIERARQDLEDKGTKIIVREGLTVSEEEQLSAIDELMEQKIDGLAIMPVESNVIRKRINDLIEVNQIPVITFNSDVTGTKRSCFVGLNNYRSGQTAAGLMAMLCKEQGKIMVITGYFANSVSSSRVEGFVQQLKESYKDMELLGVQSSYDDVDEVEKIVEQALARTPDLAGIFLASSGQEGVKRAFDKIPVKNRPYVIVYDATPENVTSLNNNEIDFLIDQEGYVQGSKPPRLLYEMITKRKRIKNEFLYTAIVIKTKYNI